MFAHLGVPDPCQRHVLCRLDPGRLAGVGARDLGAVIGQRRNLLQSKFGLLVRDVMIFNTQAQEGGGAPSLS